MAFGRESGPGAEQADWKAPEKKPFNPAMMEQTLRDIPKETIDIYKDLPPPPVGEEEIPTFLGKTIEEKPEARVEIPDMSEFDIDSFVSTIGESEPKLPSRDMLAETLPSPRQERSADYKNIPPPVETQPPEKLEMRGEKLVIDGKEFDIPPVLDEASKAILENPSLLDFPSLVQDPKQIARFMPGLDKYGQEQVAKIADVRSKLVQMEMQRGVMEPEKMSEFVAWNQKNIVETIKEAQAQTLDRKKKRAA